jgi:hypothetical protein
MPGLWVSKADQAALQFACSDRNLRAADEAQGAMVEIIGVGSIRVTLL